MTFIQGVSDFFEGFFSVFNVYTPPQSLNGKTTQEVAIKTDFDNLEDEYTLEKLDELVEDELYDRDQDNEDSND